MNFRAFWAQWTVPRNWTPPGADEVVLAQPIQGLETTLISAAVGGSRVGEVVFDVATDASSCYVIDVYVEIPFRRKMVARRLLSRALEHSGAKALVPVNLDAEALEFWLTVAKQLPVRFGLTTHELRSTRRAKLQAAGASAQASVVDPT